MDATTDITLFHAPNTRSTGVLILLEELGLPFGLHLINNTANEQRQPAYLAVNPMGKVPALRHGNAVVTEQAAIMLYLADLAPAAALAPPPGDPRRGPYLRWMVFYGSCFEPAVLDRALKREPAPARMAGYGDFATMMGVIEAQLAPGPWLLGEQFTAADVLWGTGLTWTAGFGLVEATAPIRRYIDRCGARPAVARARARDADLAARLAPA